MDQSNAISTQFNWKKWLWLDALVVFTAYTLWVVYEFGYVGLFMAALANIATAQVLIDLVLACVIAIGWMLADAKKQGIAAWPFLALTLTAGSIGLMSYIVWREFKRA